MRKKLYASASVTALTLGLVGGATSIAFAAPGAAALDGTGSGNQINVPVDVRADLCGNSLAALGISEAECTKVAEVLYASSDEGQDDSESGGAGGLASGNQINIPVDAAVDICGNSAAVGGVSEAECTKIVKGLSEESEEGDSESGGSGGLASGNRINIPVNVAVDICGNSLAVLGSSEADCTSVVKGLSEESEEGDSENGGSDGLASGNQVNVPVDAAVDICGNAVSVLGTSETGCMKKISDGEEDPGDEGDNGGNDDEGDNGGNEEEDDNGGNDDEGKSPGDDNGGNDDEGDDSPAPGDDQQAKAGLPVTGSALAGLVAAAVAAVGGGGAAMYLARKRKAAALGGDAEA